MKTADVANGGKKMACWDFKQPDIWSTVCPTLNFLISYNIYQIKTMLAYSTRLLKNSTLLFIPLM
jgi:hypothetical protein